MSEAHHEIENLRAPPGANMIAFGALLALSTIFLFTSYCMARALVGGFGAHLGTIAACVLATIAASIFLWWLVPFADFAEIFWLHLPADRRARENRCPFCGYPHESRPTCSECGRSTAPLPAWTLTARPVRRLACLLFPALLLACGMGEAWCVLDESRFVAECASSRDATYTRSRAFPAGFARMWVSEDGTFGSEAWPELGREREWQTSDELRRERGLGWKRNADAADAEEKERGARP
jgi:hypothetical protein